MQYKNSLPVALTAAATALGATAAMAANKKKKGKGKPAPNAAPKPVPPILPPAVTDPQSLDKALDSLKTFDWGSDLLVLQPISDVAAVSHGDTAAQKKLEARLLEALKGKSTRAAKDFICRTLTIVGTAQSVPALAAMLPDADESHMARYALERIPAPEAAAALRDALAKLQGKLKIGVIGSLGVRRDTQSVPALGALLAGPEGTAAAAAMADIGTPEAAHALAEASKSASGALKPALADARLTCAEQLLNDGKKGDALGVYNALRMERPSKQAFLAAVRGVAKCK